MEVSELCVPLISNKVNECLQHFNIRWLRSWSHSLSLARSLGQDGDDELCGRPSGNGADWPRSMLVFQLDGRFWGLSTENMFELAFARPLISPLGSKAIGIVWLILHESTAFRGGKGEPAGQFRFILCPVKSHRETYSLRARNSFQQ